MNNKFVRILFVSSFVIIVFIAILNKMSSTSYPELFATCLNEDYEIKAIARNKEFVEIVRNGVNASTDELDELNSYLTKKNITPDDYFTNVLAVECHFSREQDNRFSN